MSGLFVTSANLTEATLDRDIEVGLKRTLAPLLSHLSHRATA